MDSEIVVREYIKKNENKKGKDHHHGIERPQEF